MFTKLNKGDIIEIVVDTLELTKKERSLNFKKNKNNIGGQQNEKKNKQESLKGCPNNYVSLRKG